jgi:hypothetical protein
VRKALNENPLVQIGLIAVLALIVGFLLLSRVMNQGSSGEAASPATAPSESTLAPPATDPTGSEGAVAATPSQSAPPGPAAAGDQGFVAGPGLPSSVVDAFDSGKTVALLVVRTRGIDDRALEVVSTALGTRPEVQLFVLPAKNISKYSRIVSGVDVDRVPALVVISPKRLAHGGLPTASVSYGFRGPKSVVQAVEDAEYKGRTNLPYYPR